MLYSTKVLKVAEVDMDDIVPVSRGSVDFRDKLREYESLLTVDQMLALPYLAFGGTVASTSSSTGITPVVIKNWISKDIKFRTALSELSHSVEEWQEAKLRELSIKAFKKAEELLSEDLDVSEGSTSLLREQMSMAKFIIEQQGLKRNKSEVKHEVAVETSMNLEADSVDLVARRLEEIQRKRKAEEAENTVEAEYKLIDMDISMAIHPDATMGVLEYDEEEKKFKCHICAKWTHNLSDHIRDIHGVGSREYRRFFGLDKDEKFAMPRGDFFRDIKVGSDDESSV